MGSGTFTLSAGRILERVVDRLAAGDPPEAFTPDRSFDWESVRDLVREYAERRGVDPELVFRALGIRPNGSVPR